MKRSLALASATLVGLFMGSCDKLPQRWNETGQASFYSVRSNAGGTTASGEPLDDKALTAAHRTLPFRSTVKVTNLRNHLSGTVRIIYRGPFVEGRIIDLSLAAAEAIGMVEEGAVPVKIVLVKRQGTP